MDARLMDLPWLAEPPADFRNRLQSLRASLPIPLDDACRLATYRLNANQLHLLGESIATTISDTSESIRLGILSNGTTDLLLNAVSASALRYALWTKTIGSSFNQVAAEVFDPDSKINRSACHFVLLALDHRGLPLSPVVGDLEQAISMVDSCLRYVDSMRAALREASGCTVIVQTVPQLTGDLFGNLDRRIPGTPRWLIQQFNHELRSRVGTSSDLLLDIAALAENVGLDYWHDPVQWNLGKFLFSHSMIPIYADWVARVIAADRGKARKCLVLDLDNTLWGGVIGDDGLAGIVLGNGDPIGEAYLSVQRTALALRERGIVLAVCSKNDDSVARAPFRSHPDMVLREQHIAVFQANWQDKASNLRAIAKTLNIGIDSLVLLDDNPAERAQVREALPAVAAPELPADPALYADVLLSAGYFEATRFTTEDLHRAEQYQANALRAEALGTATDLTAYLISLNMKATFGPFDRIGRARITQLINKSNQFNLTTKRYSEREVEVLQSMPTGLTLQARLTDRFGDNGMVAVVTCREDNTHEWIIDTWLMSCRVLNRKLEQAMLNYIVSEALGAGVKVLVGEYIPTERNRMVEGHYRHLGFELLSETKEIVRWRLDVSTYVPLKVPIDISEAKSESVGGALDAVG